MADAAPGVAALADRLLPLPQVANRRTAQRRAHDRLREEVREVEGRDRDPSAAVIDSQAAKTTRVGAPERGYDGAKRLAGRKRHLLVDTNGLVLAARVHGADLPDRDGGRRLLGEGTRLPRLELVWADGARTRVGSASGWGGGWGGGWKCHTAQTGSCGATASRRSREDFGCYLAVGLCGAHLCLALGLSRRLRARTTRSVCRRRERPLIYGAMSRIMLRRLGRGRCDASSPA